MEKFNKDIISFIRDTKDKKMFPMIMTIQIERSKS